MMCSRPRFGTNERQDIFFSPFKTRWSYPFPVGGYAICFSYIRTICCRCFKFFCYDREFKLDSLRLLVQGELNTVVGEPARLRLICWTEDLMLIMKS